MNDKIKPALIGGAVFGVLSAIPFVNFVNGCCCAWAILGGALAVYLYIKDSPHPVQPGDAAVIGVMTGVIGTVISWVIGIPLSLIVGDAFNAMLINMMENIDPRQAETFRQQMELAQNQPLIQRIPMMLASMAFGLVVFTAFCTAGSLLGRAVFEKRKGMGPTPPPPPPGYSGQPY